LLGMKHPDAGASSGGRRKATGGARGRPAKKGKKQPRQAAGGNRGAQGEGEGLSYGNGEVGPGANTGPWIDVDANGRPIPTAPVKPAGGPAPVPTLPNLPAPEAAPEPAPEPAPDPRSKRKPKAKAKAKVSGGNIVKRSATVGEKAARSRVQQGAELLRKIHGVSPGKALPSNVKQAYVRGGVLSPEQKSVSGLSLEQELVARHTLRTTQKARQKAKRAVAAAGQQGTERRAPWGSAAADSAHQLDAEQKLRDKAANPAANLFLSSVSCGHAQCQLADFCGYGARCTVKDALGKYVALNARPEWYPPSVPKALHVVVCDDGAEYGKLKQWPGQATTLHVANESRCCSKGHTIVICIAQLREVKAEMGPVLEPTAREFAQLQSISCLNEEIPLLDYSAKDGKAEALGNRLTGPS
jgi:hypothetical protein